MCARKILIEVLAFLLVAYFFQDLLYKVWHWHAYNLWWRSLPFIHAASDPGKYVITISEAFVTFGLLFHKVRKIAASVALFGLIAIIIYVIAACVLSHHIFLPYYRLGLNARWYHVLLVNLLLAWLILLLIRLQPSSFS
jgi:hypothetical protein